MTAEYGAFSRPTFTAEDFEREEVETNEPMFATPIYAQRTTKRSGVSPALVGGVALALAVAAGAGVYMMNQRSEPVVASTKPIPVVPAAPPSEMAANTVQPVNPPLAATPATPEPVAPTVNTSRVHDRVAPVRTARANPARRAAAPSADSTGVNASATVPSSPQPYTSSTTTAPPPAPVVAPPAPTVQSQPVNPTPEAATPPAAPQVPEATTPPPNA